MDVIISIGSSRHAKQWRAKKIKWDALVDKLSNSKITEETAAEYRRMSKDEQSDIKDVGGFVGGYIKGKGRRVKGAVYERYLITLDADSPEPNFLELLNFEISDYEYVVYSTHSHTPETPRYRIILPVGRPVKTDEYQAIARRLAGDLGIENFDPTTFEPERLMYWPSAPADVEPVFIHNAGAPVDVDEVLSRYDDWRDVAMWPNSKRADEVRLHNAKKQGDPLTKPGLIGAFCRTYRIEDAIAEYLSDVYEPCDTEGRYTYKAGSTSAGLVVYDEGRFAYSHHGTDPISGKLVNAYDLVRIHKFGDDKASTGKMAELIRGDANVLATVDTERMADFDDDLLDDIDKGGKGPDKDYLKKLERDKNLKILSTAQNVKLILENDPKLRGRMALDDFSHRMAVRGDLPWRPLTAAHYWADADDASLRNYLSTVYEIVGRGVIDDGLTEVFNNNRFHPVREYLNGLTWDGVCRVDTLLIDYIGAKDTPYVRAVTRKWLCGAIARVMNPGVKFDTTLVLYGPQGLGKTLIAERLGGKWFNNTIGDVKQKDAMEQIQGSWICELAELAPTYKNDAEIVKAFLSRTVDRFRAPYGKRTEEYLRQCVFIGTTNNLLFLKDRTGNRRFWPVAGNPELQTKIPYVDLTPEEVAQIWAEALTYYLAGESLVLPPDLEKYADNTRQRHTEGSEKIGLIEGYLDTPIPENWYKWEPAQMREFINEQDDLIQNTDALVKRDRVCAIEIWEVLFEGRRQNLTNAAAREINDILQNLPGWSPKGGKLRFGRYFGAQQAFVRDA
ncbi:virulence-associated E family protein [Veillonella sp.]|uniref:virulence-associated E family protein n=1 Tax=Veillonella sp. TaxID=1926307 RepID=UPI0025DC0C69|nr:virulence-associated E family protein [Veillonella sp.]